MPVTASHQHVSGKDVRAQVAYSNSPAALETAKEIMAVKSRNSEFILTDYLHSRKRQQSDDADFLQSIQNKLSAFRKKLVNRNDRRSLFLLEAAAGREYWRAVSVICHYRTGWRRIHPHASDPLNILLNSGYVMLACRCLKTIVSAGLLPELGIYHGENSRDPLVYDFMEVFRAPAVDAVVLPVFSRRSQNKIEKDGPEFKMVLAKLSSRYQQPFWYRGRCEKLRRIIELEAVHLRQAIYDNKVWFPYQHHWGHRRLCK